MHSIPLAMVLALAALAPAQSRPVPLPSLDTWTVSANPQEVAISQSATAIGLRPTFSGSFSSPVDATSPSFAVTQAGDYVIQPDAIVAFGLGSGEDVTWSLLDAAGTTAASGTWRQRDAGSSNRDVYQVAIQLSVGTYRLRYSTQISPFGIGTLYPARLNQVDLPVLLPGLNSNYQATASAEIEIAGGTPGYRFLVFESANTLAQPILLPFGEQWLAMPALALDLGQPAWSPPSMSISGLAYFTLTSGRWWQVVEYDPASPFTTLRLGSAHFTRQYH